MAAHLALQLSQTIKREFPNLQALTEELASRPRAAGKWSPKEELGHLVDSAANNHIRFAVGAIEGEFRGSSYAQDDWIKLHGYAELPWNSIVNFWFSYNRHLTDLLFRIPESRLGTECTIGVNPPVTLGFLIEDYILHMQHHLDQLLRREQITQYPGAKI